MGLVETSLFAQKDFFKPILSSKPDIISTIGERTGNRRLEANIKQTSKAADDEDEFCLRDKETGEIILLTKVLTTSFASLQRSITIH